MRFRSISQDSVIRDGTHQLSPPLKPRFVISLRQGHQTPQSASHSFHSTSSPFVDQGGELFSVGGLMDYNLSGSDDESESTCSSIADNASLAQRGQSLDAAWLSNNRTSASTGNSLCSRTRSSQPDLEQLVDILPSEYFPNLRVLAQAAGVHVDDIYLCVSSPRSSRSPRAPSKAPSSGSPPFISRSPRSVLSSSANIHQVTRSRSRTTNSRNEEASSSIPTIKRCRQGSTGDSCVALRPPTSPTVSNSWKREAEMVKIEVLAEGTSCGVYEVTVDGWTCAMKELQLDKLDPKSLRRCEQELKVMRTVPRHPNLCNYLGSRRCGNCLQIFLTKYTTNLWWKLRDMRNSNQRFSPIEVVRVALDVIRGLMVLVRVWRLLSFNLHVQYCRLYFIKLCMEASVQGHFL